jgi:hypothetical protein
MIASTNTVHIVVRIVNILALVLTPYLDLVARPRISFNQTEPKSDVLISYDAIRDIWFYYVFIRI